MKKSFTYLLSNAQRLIVAHEAFNFENSIVDKVLQYNDMLFFDDCLYSQYVFIKNNVEELQQKNITCILGFSTSIMRISGTPIVDAICSEQHIKFHKGDMTALQAYMSIDEIKELLFFDNIFLACHGDRHIELSTCKAIQRTIQFSKDVENAILKMSKYGFQTNIYVFPYAFDNIPGAYSCLKSNGFMHIFAGKNTQRTSIESLV